MKKIYKKVMPGFAVIAACLTFAFVGCEGLDNLPALDDPEQGGGPITYTARTSGSGSTAKINFTFSAAVNGLTPADITFDVVSGAATTGGLTGSGTNWSLDINVTAAGAAAVSISKSGIEDGTKGVTLRTGAPVGITYTADANGSPGKPSTKIDFVFDADVSTFGLTADNIILDAMPGAATKGDLNMTDGTHGSMDITVTKGGAAGISIVMAGINGSMQATTLYCITYTALADGGGATATTKIDFYFNADVREFGLTTGDIAITGDGAATKNGLAPTDATGRNWSLAVTPATAGNATVSIAKAGIETGTKPITLYDGIGVFSPAPNISLTEGNATLTVTLTNTPSPAPDTYDVYWVAGIGKTAVQVMAGTKAGADLSSPYTISGLTNGQQYSVAAVAKKADYADSVSNVADGTPIIASQDLSIKFGITPSGTTTEQHVTDTFYVVHAYLATNPAVTGTGAGAKIGDIALGDYVDLVSLSIAAYPAGQGELNNLTNRDQLRLIVVGINSFHSQGSYAIGGEEQDYNDATPHLVFHFQNLPVRHRMNATNVNIGGYAASEMRKYLVDVGGVGGSFLAGLISAGVPDSVLWAPKRYVATGGVQADVTAGLIEDKLWLPTEREMFGSRRYSNATYETEINQARLAYYTNDATRVKRDAYAFLNWSASPWYDSEVYFCYVGNDGGAANGIATLAVGCAPAFCVK